MQWKVNLRVSLFLTENKATLSKLGKDLNIFDIPDWGLFLFTEKKRE